VRRRRKRDGSETAAEAGKDTGEEIEARSPLFRSRLIDAIHSSASEQTTAGDREPSDRRDEAEAQQRTGEEKRESSSR
jgi:hypothetical protein